MKKNNNNKDLNVIDYNPSMLPSNRKDQFKDIMKNNYSKLITLGFVLVLFIIPLLVGAYLRNYFVSTMMANESAKGTEQSIIYTYVRSYYVIFDCVTIVTLAIFFVGIAGALRVVRFLAYDEQLFFKHEFLTGIKENWKQTVIVSLFISITLLVFNFVNNSASISNSFALSAAGWVLLGILGFTLFPILLFTCASISIYKNSFSQNFRNSSVLAIKHYIPYILIVLTFGIFLVGFFIMSMFINILILLVVVLILTIYVFPIFILMNELFAISLFDLYINKEYPDIYRKGLKKEE